MMNLKAGYSLRKWHHIFLKEFNLQVFKPANGETVTIETPLTIYLNIPVPIIDRCVALDPTPSKRFCPFRAFLVMDKQVSL